MLDGLLYLVTSFWLGAVHAATPGHGKTIAASYIVGVRGRPVDALVLGVFVTLSHTSGIIFVAVLASLGSAWLIAQRVEAYLAVGTGILVIAIGAWMLRSQLSLLSTRDVEPPRRPVREDDPDTPEHPHAPEHPHIHEHPDTHDHPHNHPPHFHRHGWGRVHTHDVEAIAASRPSLGMLLGLGIAGGLLPDPGALAILLSAIASGRLMLGLLTVVVFSLGFAFVLVLVGVVAAGVGRLVLDWLSRRWVRWVQIGAALVIVAVGIGLTANAWRVLAALG